MPTFCVPESIYSADCPEVLKSKDLTVPLPDSEEFAFLARRLNYGSNLAQLHADLTGHTACVQELGRRLLG